MSRALLWYQSVSSGMEGVAVRKRSSSGASSYRKLSSSYRLDSSTALGRTTDTSGHVTVRGTFVCSLGSRWDRG